jgi:DNA-binding PadR family transcriptional regulator
MSLQGALAALLLRGPAHGYLLHATLEAELGRLWMTRPSQVYLTLGRMARDGLLTVRRVPQAARPDRHVFALTASGRSLGLGWLFEPGPADEIALRLAVGRLSTPGRFHELIDAIERHQTAVVHRLRQELATSAGFEREAIGLDLSRAQADLRWLGALRQRAPELVTIPARDIAPVQTDETQLA